jgi:S-adenosyl-l-methionine hydroxide adenosyltransferase
MRMLAASPERWRGRLPSSALDSIERRSVLFAHLKQLLRFGRLRLRGPCGARDEFLLAATAQHFRKPGQPPGARSLLRTSASTPLAVSGPCRIVCAGSVVLSVVDPSVGAARPPLVIEADGRWYGGLGNGLFELVERRAEQARSWEIERRLGRLSASVHGRDLFAPLASMLARGDAPPGWSRMDRSDRLD